jgi:hypothetical protein
VSPLLIFVVASAISPPEIEAEPAEPETVEPAPTEPAPTEPQPPPTQPEPAPAPDEPPTVTEPEPPPAGPPGGYWTVAEQHERESEPLDGEDELTIGSVLLSLGLVRAGAGVISVWMASRPDQCPLSDPGACSGLRNYGWVGVAEGGLMFATGITYLAIGAVRRQRYRRWERGEPLSLLRLGDALDVVDVSPWLIPRATGGFSDTPLSGAGIRLQLQF